MGMRGTIMRFRLALVWFESVFRMTLCWLRCCFMVDYTAGSISFPSWRLTCFVSFRSTGGSAALLGLTPRLRRTWLVFRNRHVSDNSNKSDKTFDLLLIQSNVQDPMLMKGVQEEKWAGGYSVWYWFIYSQTMHLIRFTILHTNVKWHTNK